MLRWGGGRVVPPLPASAAAVSAAPTSFGHMAKQHVLFAFLVLPTGDARPAKVSVVIVAGVLFLCFGGYKAVGEGNTYIPGIYFIIFCLMISTYRFSSTRHC